ncbi:MAG: aspartate kinase, partial [Candidatus Hydrothermia bacterium]
QSIEVIKFGHSVLHDTDDLSRVAGVIKARVEAGISPVVVVSAMGDQTNYLLSLAKRVSSNTGDPWVRRETDMLLTAGERISMTLLAIALNELGVRAQSFTGSQVGIVTDENFGRARIKEVKLFRITDALKNGVVPVVAGFQGVSVTREVTTLGRGGSDLTAVAIATCLGPDVPARFYKDVGWVYALNPKRFVRARKWERLSYEEALELTGFGSEVIHTRALALAARKRTMLEVRGLNEGGTEISGGLEAPGVKAIVLAPVASLVIRNIQEGTEFEAGLLTRLANEGIGPLLLTRTDREITLAVHAKDSERAAELVGGDVGLELIPGGVVLSIVGYGIGSDPGVQKEVLSALRNVKVYAMTSSELRLSFLLNSAEAPRVEADLAERFGLNEG